jgi:hypothetical protein
VTTQLQVESALGAVAVCGVAMRSGQVRSPRKVLTRRGQSRGLAMRVTRQLGLPPRYRRVTDGLESSCSRIDWCGTARPSNFEITNYAMKPVTRKAPKNGHLQLRAHARAAFKLALRWTGGDAATPPARALRALGCHQRPARPTGICHCGSEWPQATSNNKLEDATVMPSQCMSMTGQAH